MNRIVIEKQKRCLCFYEETGQKRFSCPIGLGLSPVGTKEREGDGKTPEGTYFLCLKRETGKYGCALGVSYPGILDAQRAFARGEITPSQLDAIVSACREGRRPPWGTPLGGEIYIHGGGATDWTAGCIALDDADMHRLYGLCAEGMEICILP